MIRLAVLLWLALLPAALPAATSAASATLATRIDAIVAQPRYAGADWGIAVRSLDSGRTLYAHRADKLAQPASTAKLFTAALVLATLDADARIATSLYATAPARHGRLEGNLRLYGAGDPTLGTPAANPDWADDLAAQLAAQGIHAIRGDLIADASHFAGPPLGTGWEASDLLGWFAAPASALSVHENIVDLGVAPGTHAGLPATLAFTPATAAPPLANALVTGAPRSRDDINLYRAPGDPALHAFGSIAADAPARHYRLAIPDPARLAGEELRAALARHGIRLRGQLRVLRWPDGHGALPADARPLARLLSPPVAEILGDGLKRSQNLYLQNLLQLAGVAEQTRAMTQPDPPAGFLSSEAWGLRALRELLARIGIPAADVQLQEGTGLSRGDLATPAAMVQLLQYLAAQPYADRLRAMLPTAGVDGTLEWRLRDGPAADNVQAKTGSMRHVRSLAGYLTTAGGERLAFAIFLDNDVSGPGASPATRDIDAIVALLAGYRG